jgi:hypothetical protein
MKKLLLLIILLLCGPGALAASLPQYVASGLSSGMLNPGWTFLQATGPIASGNHCTAGTSCTFSIFPTTARSVWIVGVATSNNVTISATGGWNLCTSSACHVYDSTHRLNADLAMRTGGSSSTTSITVTLSGASGRLFAPIFVEYLPPKGYTASYDGGAAIHTTSCSTACTAANPTISATDAVFHLIIPNYGGLSVENPFQWAGSPAGYAATEFLGNDAGFGLNVSSTTPATFNQGSTAGFFIDSAISFKSSAGKFATPTPVFSIKQVPENTNLSCSPSCIISGTPPASALPAIAAGDLLFLQVNTESAGVYISSATMGGSSFVVPTSCQATGVNYSTSCAYILSAPSGGATRISLTMSATAQTFWDYYEIARTSGSFALDTCAATVNSSRSLTPPGQALTLSGLNDVIFQGIQELDNHALPYSQTLYFQPAFGGGSNQNVPSWGSSAVLLNTVNGSAPIWGSNSRTTSVVFGCAFK